MRFPARDLALLSAPLFIAALSTCASAPTLDIEVSAGQEEGALSLDPKIVRIDVVATSPDNTVSVKASADVGGAFDLGEVPDNTVLSFTLTGVAADETVLARGRSVSVVPGSLADGKLPLFIERLGGWSRPDGLLVRTHVNGSVGVLAERYLILTGGDSATSSTGAEDTKNADAYDMLSLAPAQTGGVLPRSAKTMVMRGTRALLIDDTGATSAEFLSGSSGEIAAPDGMTFADVAGGRPIDGVNGVTYVVGATRAANPTAAILVMDTDGNLTMKTLIAPRVGAAATYIAGTGLVVAGGTADAPGVEIVPENGSPNVAIYPPDATTGAALIGEPNAQALLAGGVVGGIPAATRILHLDCLTDMCAYEEVPEALVATVAARTQAFAITGGMLVVGDDTTGATRAFDVQLNPSKTTEVVLREPRKGASVLPCPNGTLSILGGTLLSGTPALSVEMLFPE